MTSFAVAGDLAHRTFITCHSEAEIWGVFFMLCAVSYTCNTSNITLVIHRVKKKMLEISRPDTSFDPRASNDVESSDPALAGGLS